MYGNFGREIAKHTVTYGVFIRFWPTLRVYDEGGQRDKLQSRQSKHNVLRDREIIHTLAARQMKCVRGDRGMAAVAARQMKCVRGDTGMVALAARQMKYMRGDRGMAAVAAR